MLSKMENDLNLEKDSIERKLYVRVMLSNILMAINVFLFLTVFILIFSVSTLKENQIGILQTVQELKDQRLENMRNMLRFEVEITELVKQVKKLEINDVLQNQHLQDEKIIKFHQ